MNRQINVTAAAIFLPVLFLFSACSKSNNSAGSAAPANMASFEARGVVYKTPVAVDTVSTAGTLVIEYPSSLPTLSRDSAEVFLNFMSTNRYFSQYSGDFSLVTPGNTVNLTITTNDSVFSSYPSTTAVITSNDGKTITGTFSGQLQSDNAFPPYTTIQVTNGSFSVRL